MNNELSINSSITPKKSLKIAIIGSGFMGMSIAKGILKVNPKTDLTMTDIYEERLEFIKDTLSIKASSDNIATCKDANVIILAVKPYAVSKILNEISKVCNNDKLIISIAAGVTIDTIEKHLDKVPVIRAMPNICVQVQEGAIAYALGNYATEKHKSTTELILGAVGLTIEIEESKLDAVTGLSGSGPAYIFMAIEALSDGGVLSGLPRDISNKLAAQTVIGSAKMYLETGLHAGALKDMVTSPGGTTINGVKVLEDKGMRSAFIGAVKAATDRSKELS